MKCKKCGFDGIEESGDWITCPNCGAKYFNTSISPELSATKQIDAIENKMAGNSEQKPYGNDDSAGLGESAQTEEPNGGKKGKKQKKKKSKFRETIDFLLPIIIAVIVALLLKTFVFANAVVPTGSMKNTIGEGDRIIASRLAYINSDPERYDIILFYFPDDESQIFVKRVIGLPGETVTIVDGSAFITDKDGNTYETDQSFITNGDPIGDYGPFYIPEKGETITTDGVFCYAENGMRVGYSQFIDKYCDISASGEYTVAENLYFCMGDNRNESHDSRFWDNTYVAENKILGEAKFKYYPKFETLK
jgi:signal peptidase I